MLGQNEIAVDIKHCASAIEVVNRELEEWKLSSIFTEVIKGMAVYIGLNFN